MNAHTDLNADMAFKSSRRSSADHVPEAPMARPDPVAKTSVLMISTSAVVLEHFANLSGLAEGTTVTSRNATLAQVLDESESGAFDHDIVVFERTDDDDTEQMETLRQIASACGGRTRFMVLTAANLSLAQARALIDAGVEEVIPMSSILPPPPPPPVAATPAPGAGATG